LKGADMLLDEASVTGTAYRYGCSFSQGRTTVYNAACEPYLQQLCKINSMGANITGVDLIY
jgi:UDP-N-acetylglucosamine 1-carboxyvinyltransferase